jgi:hypothetical protein
VADDDGALGLGLCGGLIGRAVVDDEHVETRRLAEDVANDAPDHPGLVVGGDDRELAQVVR